MRTTSLFFAMFFLVLFTQCNKNEESKPDASEVSTQPESADQDPYDEETSYALSLLSSSTSPNTKVAVSKTKPCGAEVEVDTLPVTTGGKKKLRVRMTFDGMIECYKNNQPIKKQGLIVFQIITGDSWEDAGAVVSKTYANYKEFRSCATCGQESLLVAIEGTQHITNVTGGYIEDAPVGGTIVHHIDATNLSLSFENGKKRIENISEIQTGKKVSATDFEFSITGKGTYNGMNNVAIWGTTNGAPFHTIYNQPKVYNTCSGKGKLIRGEAFFKKGSDEIVEIYGVNKNGVPVNNCSAYGFKSTTTKANGQVTTVICKY